MVSALNICYQIKRYTLVGIFFLSSYHLTACKCFNPTKGNSVLVTLQSERVNGIRELGLLQQPLSWMSRNTRPKVALHDISKKKAGTETTKNMLSYFFRNKNKLIQESLQFLYHQCTLLLISNLRNLTMQCYKSQKYANLACDRAQTLFTKLFPIFFSVIDNLTISFC